MNSIRPARLLAVCVLCCAAGCIVATCVTLSTMSMVYGMALQFGDVLVYLYQINAFFCLFAALYACAFLFAKRGRGVLLRVACWGMLVLATMYVTPFVTDTLSYLGAMPFLQAFRYACAYLPFFAVVAAMIALLTEWTSDTRGAVSVVIMICSLVSVFAGVVYLWQIVPAAVPTGDSVNAAHDLAQIWAIMLGCLCVILVSVCAWFSTQSTITYLRLYRGLSESEAEITEEADRLQAEQRAEVEKTLSEERAKDDMVISATFDDADDGSAEVTAAIVEVGTSTGDDAVVEEETPLRDAPAKSSDSGKTEEDL